MKNNSIKRKKYLESKITLPLKLLLIIISVLLVFVSVNNYTFNQLSLKLNVIFFTGIGNPHFFSILDIMVILISLLLIKKYRLNFANSSKIAKFIFIFAIICFILKMLNPNSDTNNPIFGLPLFSDITNYSNLLILVTVLFIDKDVFIIFIKKFFLIISIFIIVRLFILYAFWFLGKVYYITHLPSILPEMDSLFYFGFFRVIFLALFLISRKKKYLIFWFLLLFIMLISYRRNAFYVSLFSDISIYIIYTFKTVNLKTFLKRIIFLLIIFSFNNILITKMYNFQWGQDVINRYSNIFDVQRDPYTPAEESHFIQTQITTINIINKGEFWGCGYGAETSLEGAYRGIWIHNAYADLWARYGLFMVIYYVSLIFIFIYELFYILRHLRKLNLEFVLIKCSVIFFFLYYMIGMVFLPSFYLEKTKMFILIVFIIGFILKFKPDNFELAFKNK